MKIELQDIHKRYGPVRANDGVSLTVQTGSVHGLLGENGAGKTTLMKILSGYVAPDSGRLVIDGQPVHFASPQDALAHGIGMLHQDPLDVPQMTALDNLSLGLESRFMMHRREMRREFTRQCRELSFDLDPDSVVGSLTVGERQQLEIMRLMALGVRLLILDEPTTGISAPQKRVLFGTVRRLASEGMSVILVSHKLDDVLALCHRATVLRSGRVAGEAEAPLESERLVMLMFGQVMAGPSRAEGHNGEPVLDLVDGRAHSTRLTITDLRLTLHAGEIVGVAGLEGSGQDLLLRVCAGLTPLSRGRLWVHGHDLTRANYADVLKAGVAFVPAARLEEGLIGGLSIREHVALVAQPTGPWIGWEGVSRRAEEMVREHRIMGAPQTLVESLSGGNQQRTILALLPRHLRVAVLEQPTRGLDLESAQWVWQRLQERCREGTAILFSSSDLDELVEHSDRLVVFSGGCMSRPVDASRVTVDELGQMIGGRTDLVLGASKGSVLDAGATQ